MSTQPNHLHDMNNARDAQDTNSVDASEFSQERQRRIDLMSTLKTATANLKVTVNGLQAALNARREEWRQRSLPPADYHTRLWLRGAEYEILSLEEVIIGARAEIENWNQKIRGWELHMVTTMQDLH